MANHENESAKPYRMEFDVYTIKHLGLQMYSTLPPVIGELVANGWDANATKVSITIPETPMSETSEIVISDNGMGMSDDDVRKKYLIVGRDRRESEDSDETPAPHKRKVMGRKGIGKFSAFGVAKEIDIESARANVTAHFRMNYDEMLERASDRHIEFPSMPPSGEVSQGTTIRLKRFIKFKNRRIPIGQLRRRLARRFSVISPGSDFQVVVNGSALSPEERDLKRLLEIDADGRPYIWEYEDREIEPNTGWRVSGWIGALNRTTPSIDGVDPGVTLMARGKLVQEPFVFGAVVGQQYALSYIIGELHVEFVDEAEDTIGTNRNALVWDTEANTALRKWGEKEVNRIARQWARKRSSDNERRLEENPAYREFQERASETDSDRAKGFADRLVRQAIRKNPTANDEELQPIIQYALDFIEFDAFLEIAESLADADLDDPGRILGLFREWEIVEAKEMSKIAEGRAKTIAKLQALIEKDALEVPTLHNFLKEFPWVIDPRWSLVDDEVRYSQILRERFPEKDDVPESDRRIDFLCVRESSTMVVVEIKRPGHRANARTLEQIEEYVGFMRHHTRQTTDPEFRYETVIGYLLCGDMVERYQVTEKRDNLAKAQIYVKTYDALLSTARRVHEEFMERYEALRNAKRRES